MPKPRSRTVGGNHLSTLQFFPPYKAITAILCHHTQKKAAESLNTDGEYLSKYLIYRGLSFAKIKAIQILTKGLINRIKSDHSSYENFIKLEVKPYYTRSADRILSILSKKARCNELLESNEPFLKLTRTIAAILLSDGLKNAITNELINTLYQQDETLTHNSILNFAKNIAPGKFIKPRQTRKKHKTAPKQIEHPIAITADTFNEENNYIDKDIDLSVDFEITDENKEDLNLENFIGGLEGFHTFSMFKRAASVDTETQPQKKAKTQADPNFRYSLRSHK